MNLYAVIDSSLMGITATSVRAETRKRAVEIAKVDMNDAEHTIKIVLLSTKGKEKLILWGGEFSDGWREMCDIGISWNWKCVVTPRYSDCRATREVGNMNCTLESVRLYA